MTTKLQDELAKMDLLVDLTAEAAAMTEVKMAEQPGHETTAMALIAALNAACSIMLRRVVKHESRIEQLEKEVEALKAKLN